MIISCNNCSKKFEVDSSLIPEKGRLLQCNGCNQKWFFKNEIIDKPIPVVKINTSLKEQKPSIEEITLLETETSKTIEFLDSVIKDDSVIKKNQIENNNNEEKVKTSKNKKNYNILGLIIIFIISFIALILVLDTFQKPISNIVPNIEFLLYNLYETLNDIVLFFRDLI